MVFSKSNVKVVSGLGSHTNDLLEEWTSRMIPIPRLRRLSHHDASMVFALSPCAGALPRRCADSSSLHVVQWCYCYLDKPKNTINGSMMSALAWIASQSYDRDGRNYIERPPL